MTDFHICSISDCGKAAVARGWCNAHYRRWKRHGSPVLGRTPPGEPFHWIIKNAEYDSKDCLIWPYARGGNGYAIVVVEGQNRVASRVMCEMAHGNAPEATYDAAHSCGNGHLGCMNPAHLRWAKHSENCEDRVRHGTSNRGVRHGTSNRGVRHGNAKLQEADIVTIRSLKGKATLKEVADKFGISFQHVSAIQRGDRWAHFEAMNA